MSFASIAGSLTKKNTVRKKRSVSVRESPVFENPHVNQSPVGREALKKNASMPTGNRTVRARDEISVSGHAQDFDRSPRRCCSSIAVTMVQNRNTGIRLKDKQDVTVISSCALTSLLRDGLSRSHPINCGPRYKHRAW